MAGLGLLRYNTQMMKTIGLWPLDTSSRPLLMAYWLYTALLVISLAVVSVCQAIEIFVSPNITSMASAVDLATLTASALFKMIYIIHYRDYFQRLVDKMDSAFVEKDFFDGKFNIFNWVKYSKIVIIAYVTLGGPTLFIVGGVFPCVIPQYFKRYQTNVNDFRHLAHPYRKRMFPFNCWFPFDVTWSPLYEIVYTFEVLSLVASGQIYLVSDSLFFMIIFLLCGQMELLKTSYKSLQGKTAPTGYLAVDGNETCNIKSLEEQYSWEFDLKKVGKDSIAKQKLKLLVDFHCHLIEIMRDLDTLLRSLVMVDFIHAVVSLSFAAFEISILESGPEKFQIILFIFVCVIHQFLNNFFAEMLTQKQLSVSEALYETPWVDGANLHKMAVYMTRNQAKHPTRLSGWRMYHLGLGTFVEFMKLLGSYVLVLQSIQGNESGLKLS